MASDFALGLGAKSSVLYVGVTVRACDGVGAVKIEFLTFSR